MAGPGRALSTQTIRGPMLRNLAASRRGGRVPGWLAAMLALFTAIGPVSTDIYLPALPEIEQQLRSAPGSGSGTMAAWVVGLAVGQITIGPVSDRFGRRLPLLIGMTGYALGEIGCALAPSMLFLCLCRMFSAVMASAGLVIPNACIRDLTEGDSASRLMSRLVVIQGVVPVLAPMLGGFALRYVSWRAIFWATALYGGICVALLLTVFPETLPLRKRRDLRPLSIVERYLFILRTRSFLTNALVWSFQGFITFTYLSGAPVLFEERFGLSPFRYGMLFGLFAVFMIGASFLNGLLVGRFGASRMLSFALRLSLAGGLLFVLLAAFSSFDVRPEDRIDPRFFWPLTGALLLTLAPTGIIGPNTMAGILSEQSERAGSAAALAGTMQYLFGAVASGLFGLIPATTALPLALFLLFATAAALFAASFGPRDDMKAEERTHG